MNKTVIQIENYELIILLDNATYLEQEYAENYPSVIDDCTNFCASKVRTDKFLIFNFLVQPKLRHSIEEKL